MFYNFSKVTTMIKIAFFGFFMFYVISFAQKEVSTNKTTKVKNKIHLKNKYFEGMNYIDTIPVFRNTLNVNLSEQDTNYFFDNDLNLPKAKPFYISDHEVTNGEYREFVNWVRDSIAREKIVRRSLDSEQKKWITNVTFDSGKKDKKGDFYILNWDKKLNYEDPEISFILSDMFEESRYYSKRNFDTRFFYFDYYDGEELNRINVYPDTLVWWREMNLDDSSPQVNAFWNLTYVNFPVVGVTFEQARAYCIWRTMMYHKEVSNKNYDHSLKFRLPNEEEWERAAMSFVIPNKNESKNCLIPITNGYETDINGYYHANFGTAFLSSGINIKDSRDDGILYLCKVKSYEPNFNGLYCMFGNAAEWVDATPKLGDFYFDYLKYFEKNKFYNTYCIPKSIKVYITDPYTDSTFLVERDSKEHISLIRKRLEFYEISPKDSYELAKSKFLELNSINEAFRSRINQINSSKQFFLDDLAKNDWKIGFEGVLLNKISPKTIEIYDVRIGDYVFLSAVDSINFFTTFKNALNKYKQNSNTINSTFETSKDRFWLVANSFNDIKIVKGGSWRDQPHYLFLNNSQVYSKDESSSHIGFRIAADAIGNEMNKYDKKRIKIQGEMLSRCWYNSESERIKDSLLKEKTRMLNLVRKSGSNLEFTNESLKNDREVVLTAVKENGLALQFANESLKKDKVVVLKAVNNNGYALQFADLSLRKDKEVVLEAMIDQGSSFQYADDSLKKDKNFVKEAIKQSEYVLEFINESLKKDKEVMLVAVRLYGSSLRFADESLKKDKDVVIAALNNSGFSLEYVDESLKKDKDVVNAAVNSYGQGWSIQYADPCFKKNKEIILSAIKNCGYDLSDIWNFIDDSLKNDHEFVLEAIKENCHVLELTDDSMRKDKELVLIAIKQGCYALQYADESLRKDKEIVLSAIKHSGGYNLKFADETLKKDKEVALAAVKESGSSLEFVDDFLKDDKEIIITAIENGADLIYADKKYFTDKNLILKSISNKYNVGFEEKPVYLTNELLEDEDFVKRMLHLNGTMLKFLSDKQRKSKQLVEIAVKENGLALKYADRTLKNDREISWYAVQNSDSALAYLGVLMKYDKHLILEAVKNFGRSLEFTDKSFQKDKKVALEAVKNDGWAFHYVDESLKNDKDILMAALKVYPSWLEGASYELRNDKEVVLTAVQSNGWALKYASKRFQNDREVVLTAVKNLGSAIQFASDSLRKDKEIVLAALTNDSSIVQFIDLALILDLTPNKKIVELSKKELLDVLQNDGLLLRNTKESFPKDKEIVLTAVEQNGEALEFADESLKKDKEVVRAAINQNSSAFYFADESLLKDKELVLLALKNGGFSLQDADSTLLKNKEFMIKAIKIRPSVIHYVHHDLLLDDDIYKVWDKVKKDKNY